MIPLDPNGVWYHGSDKQFSVLKAGSTITQWKQLAQAFSHKPTQLSYSEDGRITHNGQRRGYLYQIDEPVQLGDDVFAHPHSSMDPNAEFLTKRPLKVKLLAVLP